MKCSVKVIGGVKQMAGSDDLGGLLDGFSDGFMGTFLWSFGGKAKLLIFMVVMGQELFGQKVRGHSIN